MFTYLYQDNLQSTRLSTRFITRDDIKIWSTFYEDEEATEFFPPSQLTNQEQATQWIERLLNRYANKQYGFQAILKKGTNEFLGQCGLLMQEVDGVPELEVGYHFLKKHWGHGYAPEAAKLFIDYTFQNDLAESLISIIDTGNIKSQRVADKNGLVREKETRWREFEVFIYRIKKKDWNNVT